MILALTQTAGWGMVSVLPALGSRIADDLGLSLPLVFAGASVQFVGMGLAAPIAGRAFIRFGPRVVMAAGCGLGASGLILLASAHSALVFFTAWALIGLFGAAFLTTAAYVYLNAIAPERARTAIGSLMLVTGLATTLFWPLTTWLAGLIGWRETLLAYGVATAAILPTLILWGLPEPRLSGPGDAAKPDDRPAPRLYRDIVFWLLIATVSLNSFVTVGLEAVSIELLKGLGFSLEIAVGVAAAIGVAKVFGRLADLAGGPRWDGLDTARAASLLMPLGLLALGVGEAAFWSVVLFLVLFGIGGGAFAIARATMPLAFYDKAGYAAAASGLALPLNLINAAAPPLLATALTQAGPRLVLAIACACSVLALLLVLALRRFRPALSRTPDAHPRTSRSWPL